MRVTTFAVIWTILYIGFGLGLLFIPAQFMTTYGVTLDDGGTLMARILGAALASNALTFWFNRKVAPTEKAWRNLLLTSLIYNIVDIPIAAKATMDGVMNSMGWVPVGLHVFLAATMGYFAFSKTQQR
jgi:hypothetical protein